MKSALVLSRNGPALSALTSDLVAVGLRVVSGSDWQRLTHDAITNATDLVIVHENSPDSGLFQSTASLQAQAPRPVIVFTMDPDAENIELAIKSGVHAYVIDGYSQARLRSVMHLAEARFRHDQALRQELAQVNQRFAERKLVDRARGILMGARQLREEEAYRALRRAAMHTKQRIGQISQQVIDSARYGEAVNRAGRLRMLSQRLVKLYALACIKIRPAETGKLFATSLHLVDTDLDLLTRTVSKATFGDLLDAVLVPWKGFRSVLTQPADTGRLEEIDRVAEQFLLRSEQLTANLEIAAFKAALHVINVAGRQRMLSQRFAKAALISVLLTGRTAEAAMADLETTSTELIDAMTYLRNVPLSNEAIGRELDQAAASWAALQGALDHRATVAGQESIAGESEILLGHFEVLTEQFERGMQALIV